MSKRWRKLEVGEIIRKGDRIVYDTGLKEPAAGLIGTTMTADSQYFIAERRVKSPKWRDLEDGETFESGDRCRLPKENDLGWLYIRETSTLYGATVGSWRIKDPKGGRAQRRVRKVKTPGLAKLLRRLPLNSYATIVAEGGNYFVWAGNIADLKAYLETLPERED